MKNKILLNLGVLTIMNLYSIKPPGYLSKKNCLSIGTGIPILARTSTIENLNINPSIELNYERTLKKYFSISLSFQHQNVTVSDFYTISDYSNSSFIAAKQNSYQIRYYPYEMNYFKFQNNQINASFLFYFKNKGAISPMGKYFKIGLNNNIFKIIDTDIKYIEFEDNTIIKNQIKDYVSMQLFSINTEIGKKTFFKDHFFYNWALGFNIPTNFWVTNIESNFFDNVSNYEEMLLKNYFPRFQNFYAKFSIGYNF